MVYVLFITLGLAVGLLLAIDQGWLPPDGVFGGAPLIPRKELFKPKPQEPEPQDEFDDIVKRFKAS